MCTGVHLPALCEAQLANPRRYMFEIQSSGVVRSPVSSPGAIAVELESTIPSDPYFSPGLAPIPA